MVHALRARTTWLLIAFAAVCFGCGEPAESPLAEDSLRSSEADADDDHPRTGDGNFDAYINQPVTLEREPPWDAQVLEAALVGRYTSPDGEYELALNRSGEYTWTKGNDGETGVWSMDPTGTALLFPTIWTGKLAPSRETSRMRLKLGAWVIEPRGLRLHRAK